MAQQSGRVLIVGAGMAGLSLARQFKRLNIPFTLIDKRDHLATTGAGIALPANAVKALRYLGLGEEIEREAHRVEEIIYSNSNGSLLSKASLLEPPLNVDLFVALRRRQLHAMLCDGLEEHIHFKSTVQSIHPIHDDVVVRFDSPTLKEENYSAVIGADGLRSRIRKLTFGDISLVDLSVTNWRWTCDYQTNNLQPIYMIGVRSAFMVYPISENSVYCYAQIFDAKNKWAANKNYREAIRKIFSHYGGIAKSILETLPENNAIIPGRLRSVPKPLFTKGRVALVGDASSACSPLLQQGAASAFEDAIVLSELLVQFPVEIAFKNYEKYRKKRVNWIVQTSDKPLKMIAKVNPFFAFFILSITKILIRLKGPLNVQKWRKLLVDDPISQLPKYIQSIKNPLLN